ncbi:MAG: hypothetical protein V7636_1295 [Actinomycetota bacterium]|jgi:Ser/Thr protein kinase RdoA (MazF antagonist)
MTKGGDFKRAVRREARASGLSYTQALARRGPDRGTVDERIASWRRWRRVDGLTEHFATTYDVHVVSITTLSEHGGGIFKVDLADHATAWVVRVVPPAARTPESIGEDVKILRLLEHAGFPAERCAHENPISSYGGQTVLVTTHVAGTARPNTVEHARRLGDALGRLHAIDIDGEHIRDGGAWGHDPECIGKPIEDVRAARGYLDAAVAHPADDHDHIVSLRAALDDVDACVGLPEALTTPRTGGPNVLVTDDGTPVFVDWKSGGRGPRLSAFSGLLSTAARTPIAHDVVDAIVDGYSQHIRLTSAELDRLPGAIRLQPAYYAAWGYWRAVANGHPPDGTESWWPDDAASDAVADRVVARLARPAVVR